MSAPAPPSLYGRPGVVVLPIDDPVVLAHLPEAGAEICHGCVTDSSGTRAAVILWIAPRPDRPYLSLCRECLDVLAGFFAWWAGR